MTLSIDVTDDLSGVKSVAGNVRSPSGVAVLPFEAQADSGGSVHSVRITIPASAETGVWYVANLFVYDRADNALIESYTPQTVPAGGTMRVASTDSDATPPEVGAVSVEKATVGGGERNRVMVEARDDRSGVANVTGFFETANVLTMVTLCCGPSLSSRPFSIAGDPIMNSTGPGSTTIF